MMLGVARSQDKMAERARRRADREQHARDMLITRLVEKGWLIPCSRCRRDSFTGYSTDALALALEGQVTLDPNPTHLCR